jgi:hypothetical protein
MNELLELLAEVVVKDFSLGHVKRDGSWVLFMDNQMFEGKSPIDVVRAATRSYLQVATKAPTISRVILSDGTELNTFAGQPVSRLGKEVMPT